MTTPSKVVSVSLNGPPEYLMATCQVGAESALKREVERDWPSFRVAYSRPGFVTFRLPVGHFFKPDFQFDAVFARAYAFSLGKVGTEYPLELPSDAYASGGAMAAASGGASASGVGSVNGVSEEVGDDVSDETRDEMRPLTITERLLERAKLVWQLAGSQTFQRIHVWERDAAIAGSRRKVVSVCESVESQLADADVLVEKSQEVTVAEGLSSALRTSSLSSWTNPVVYPQEGEALRRASAPLAAKENSRGDGKQCVRRASELVPRYEPRVTPFAERVARALVTTCPRPSMLADTCRQNPYFPAANGDYVLDVVLVGPQEWWVGFHQVASHTSQMAGGLLPIQVPSTVVSRAWLKMEEALWWSEFPLRPGVQCVEIGSAPGGASQSLLARGVRLIGIDPAEMDPAVLADPRFTHIRKRTHEVKRKIFRNVRWLTADMNVAPEYTLDSVEGIVTYPECGVRGMLLTFKLFEWSLADQIPQFLERIRSWGFQDVRARQLQHNRQEICVACLKSQGE